LFLKLEGHPVLVVGAGTVAAQKIGSLLRCGARVTVVAPHACEAVAAMARRGHIDLRLRAFELGDVDAQRLVIAATSEPHTNEIVMRCGRARRVLVNVVDDPERCDFYVPSVIDRGALQVAVSTQGASPALARTLRKEIERYLHPSLSRYVELVAQARSRIKHLVPGGYEARRVANEAVLASDARRLLEDGDEPGATAAIEAELERLRKGEAAS
jgi:siroheme synthase-like protein